MNSSENHGQGSISRDLLVAYTDNLLESVRIKDYCPNGLQVEGRPQIGKIISGVTASQDLIEAAIQHGADALLVHHGWFWKGESGRITGFRKKRLQRLLEHDINLIAYHLPLDGHPSLGNNAQLGQRFGWSLQQRVGEGDLVWIGSCPTQSVAQLAQQLEHGLGRTPLVIGSLTQPLNRIGWCTGGAQDYFEAAIDAGVDVFVSGEISEQTVHLARESGVSYIAAGHHATERYGVQALGLHLAEHFGIQVQFIDLPNPV